MESSPFLVVARAILKLNVRTLVAYVKFPSMMFHVCVAVRHAQTWERLSFVIEDSKKPSTCWSIIDHGWNAGLGTSLSLPSEYVLLMVDTGVGDSPVR
jgi:hypothetical protein